MVYKANDIRLGDFGISKDTSKTASEFLGVKGTFPYEA